jgi:hypothetical protein
VGWKRRVPDQLDADATERIAHSFAVVRIVRGSLFLVFLALALLGVVYRSWPDGVAVAIALTMLVQAGALAGNVRKLQASSARGRAG